MSRNKEIYLSSQLINYPYQEGVKGINFSPIISLLDNQKHFIKGGSGLPLSFKAGIEPDGIPLSVLSDQDQELLKRNGTSLLANMEISDITSRGVFCLKGWVFQSKQTNSLSIDARTIINSAHPLNYRLITKGPFLILDPNEKRERGIQDFDYYYRQPDFHAGKFLLGFLEFCEQNGIQIDQYQAIWPWWSSNYKLCSSHIHSQNPSHQECEYAVLQTWDGKLITSETKFKVLREIYPHPYEDSTIVANFVC